MNNNLILLLFNANCANYTNLTNRLKYKHQISLIGYAELKVREIRISPAGFTGTSLSFPDFNGTPVFLIDSHTVFVCFRLQYHYWQPQSE